MIGSTADEAFVLTLPGRPGPCRLDQITDADRQALSELAAEARLVIDVGTYLGGSAEALLAGMPADGHLVTIDTFTTPSGPTPVIPPGSMVVYALGRLDEHLAARRATVIVGDSRMSAGLFARASADLVFLDAGHTYEALATDILAWAPVLKLTGTLAGHDFEPNALDRLAWEDIVARSGSDWDKPSGLHCGVVRAVIEAFGHLPPGQLQVSGHPASTVWRVKPRELVKEQ